MKIVTIPAEQPYLSDLLSMVQEDGVILQTADGQQFVLLSLDEWQGFEVGDSEDFPAEVQATSENQGLLAFLAERQSQKKRTSLADVKKQLGLS